MDNNFFHCNQSLKMSLLLQPVSENEFITCLIVVYRKCFNEIKINIILFYVVNQLYFTRIGNY